MCYLNSIINYHSIFMTYRMLLIAHPAYTQMKDVTYTNLHNLIAMKTHNVVYMGLC